MIYNVKNIVFNFLSPRQKTALLSYVKSYVKKHQTFEKSQIIDSFIEDESYYIQLKTSRFEFLNEYFSNEEFLRDLGIFIDAVFNELKQKEALKPILEKQKEFQKQQQKKANDYKMSKLKPTKKQLLYYQKISFSHGIEMKNTQNASRLDLRNWIMEIIEPQGNSNE